MARTVALTQMYSQHTILLIEDDRDDQEFFTLTVEEMKYAPRIDVVNNGKEALDRLYRSMILPTVIFMDINMPLMNGMECLKCIKDDPLIRHIPVVMLTTSIEEKERALQLGAEAFIRKPNTEEKLRDAIGYIIRHYFPLK